jgi:hypothetical protein
MGKIGYQSLSGGGTDVTMVMGSVTVAGLTIGAASRDTDTRNIDVNI